MATLATRPFKVATAARLARLVSLEPCAQALVEKAVARPQRFRQHTEILREGQPVTAIRLVTNGWAAKTRMLPDGRQQLLGFLLPGDLIGHCRHPRPLAVCGVTALTELELCVMPPPSASPSLAAAYAMSTAIEEAYLLEHIARLGQLSAHERVISLLLELNERLTLAGLARDGSFTTPLTQERLAETLGLSAVHINRVLQQARRHGELLWQGRNVTLIEPEALAQRIGRVPVSVSGIPKLENPRN